MALLKIRGRQCGGTLISDEWIVTSANCVASGDPVLVGLGYYNSKIQDEFTLTFNALQVIMHQDYNVVPFDNDIAMVKIPKVDFARYPHIRPACLPEVGFQSLVGDLGTIIGWGSTSEDGILSDVLQEADIPIMSNSDCSKTYHFLTDNMICAARPEGGVDSCRGDGGGPLVVKSAGVTNLVGVTSFGYRCALPGYPGVYTRVTSMVSRIEPIVQGSLIYPTPPTGGIIPPGQTFTTTAAPPAPPRTVAPPEASDCLCGKKGSAGRIVGGAPSDKFEYPWMVSLGIGRGQYCGATLISDKWIVTAAHCITPGNEVTVGLGYHNLDVGDQYTLRRTVIEVVVHPDYVQSTNDNDIALLRIDAIDWATNPKIRPACLPDTDDQYTGQTATITGWGKTTHDGYSTLNLLEVDIPIMSNAECGTSYRITPNMICAGVPEGGLDSCQGDSGGPMIVDDAGSYELVGIVSFGRRCASPGYPGVYARVTQYRSWINGYTNGLGYCPRA
uniref:Transmembrane protease serine 9-like n=1 Tax=Hirondellea gigas TaxID=1518452 RepID=A0A2P2HW09_9CRUS